MKTKQNPNKRQSHFSENIYFSQYKLIALKFRKIEV